MAKKGHRMTVLLACEKCNLRGYRTTVNQQTRQQEKKEKLNLQKYCSNCRVATGHKETKLPPSKKA